ncbi:hypothetical protein EGW08_012053, partial [Elysia chlorotica]
MAKLVNSNDMQDVRDSHDIKSRLRPITAAPLGDADISSDQNYGPQKTDMNRNKEVGGFFSNSGSNCGVSNNNISNSNGSSSNFFSCNEEPLDINVRNLENLSLMDNFSSM